MIIARIFGGLGNQLFIFYSAKSLSIKNNCKLILDVHSGYKKDKFGRTFLIEKIINPKKNLYYLNYSLYNNKFSQIIRNINKLVNLFLPINLIYYYKDNNNFNHNFKKITKNTYLDSYLQFHDYFKDIKEIIDNDYYEILSSKYKKISFKKILTSDIAICFRSFNEIKNKKNISWDYYFNALKIIEKKIKNFELHVFTDDVDFVLQRYPKIKKYKIRFINNDNDPINVLLDLSRYETIIISDSTFHWWAAYFNDQNKNIYAPSKNNKNSYYYPKNWTIINE